jgi:hypothetical protein
MCATREPKSKRRVVLEEGKIRRTTHWDMDYLPLRQVDALYERPSVHPGEPPAESPPETTTNRRWGLICILAGLGLLGLAVSLARWWGA